MHVRHAPAYTYAMKIEGTAETLFKVGWAFDYKKRQRDFNLSSLPQLGGLRYKESFIICGIRLATLTKWNRRSSENSISNAIRQIEKSCSVSAMRRFMPHGLSI